MKSIYLDYNATTPIPPEVADAMIPFLREHFGNPSSSHPYGIATKQAIENARQQVAGLIQCSPEEIVFTSGGTESNNYAIRALCWLAGIKEITSSPLRWNIRCIGSMPVAAKPGLSSDHITS
jgi:cysteine sulfinate desulfinase/cysteine desulfurase-like protein